MQPSWVDHSNLLGPDAGFKALLGLAPGDSHEAPVLQGWAAPHIDWLIASTDAVVMDCWEVGESCRTPASITGT